jgi:hypothetical protein
MKHIEILKQGFNQFGAVENPSNFSQRIEKLQRELLEYDYTIESIQFLVQDKMLVAIITYLIP